MKTKITLLFIFSCIVIIDIACLRNTKGGGCGNARFDIIGIDTILVLEKNQKGQYSPLSNDTMAYDSVVYALTFTEKEMAAIPNFSFISSANAVPCPEPYTDWSIDSIKIYCVSKTDKTDFTNRFSVTYANNDILKINNADQDFIYQLNYKIKYSNGIRFYFNLDVPPAKTDEVQFNFQFFDKKGRMYEKMSAPVVITN